MSDPIVYFAPILGAHKAASDPDLIVIRRPAEFNKDGGSASAIKIEAYVRGGPLQRVWNGETQEWEWSQLSEPIFTTLIWVSGDHRPAWDARTQHRCGSTGLPEEFMSPQLRAFASTKSDVWRVCEALEYAKFAIHAWRNPSKL